MNKIPTTKILNKEYLTILKNLGLSLKHIILIYKDIKQENTVKYVINTLVNNIDITLEVGNVCPKIPHINSNINANKLNTIKIE